MPYVAFIFKNLYSSIVHCIHVSIVCMKVYGRDSWEPVFDNFVQEITVYNTELVLKFLLNSDRLGAAQRDQGNK